MGKHLTTSYKTIINFTVRDINVKYETLNYGGCGLFARALGNALELNGFNVDYIIVCKGYRGLLEVNKLIADGDYEELLDSPYLWFHTMVKVNGKFIDSTGVYDSLTHFKNKNFEYNRLDPRFSKPTGKSFIKHFVGSFNGWNEIFDRMLIIDIEKKLLKDLVY